MALTSEAGDMRGGDNSKCLYFTGRESSSDAVVESSRYEEMNRARAGTDLTSLDLDCTWNS